MKDPGACLAQTSLSAPQVLTALAAACDEIASKAVNDTDTLALLCNVASHEDERVCCASLIALSNLAFPERNKSVILQHTRVMAVVRGLASAAEQQDVAVRNARDLPVRAAGPCCGPGTDHAYSAFTPPRCAGAHGSASRAGCTGAV